MTTYTITVGSVPDLGGYGFSSGAFAGAGGSISPNDGVFALFVWDTGGSSVFIAFTAGGAPAHDELSFNGQIYPLAPSGEGFTGYFGAGKDGPYPTSGTISFEYPPGGTPVTGTMAATEAADTISASGSVGVSGALAASEGADTLAAIGDVVVTGTMAATEAGDTAVFSDQVITSGTIAAGEDPDTAAFAGDVSTLGTIAATEAPDIALFKEVGRRPTASSFIFA